MGKLFVPLSSTVFALIIFVLLLLSVGLLVFVLKGQIQHENSMSSTQPIVSGSVSEDMSRKTTPSPEDTTDSNEISDVIDLTTSGPPDESPWEDFRLPKYIVPLNYELLLHPNLGNDSFSGSVNITVNVTRDTKYFVVHAYRLVVLQAKVYRDEDEVAVKRSFLYDPNEYFVVETQYQVGTGQYRLEFDFSGPLVGSIVGFYKSRYTDIHNETRYLATSKFQPTYARRAFPCFDEPTFKSTFQVALVHYPEYIALSNMPVKTIEPYRDNLRVTRFQKSVPMVTYLSCFIVCDFNYTETTLSNGKPFRVYSTAHQVHKTEYAVKFGSRVLEYFEDYFGISYPLPKQDMVAIPDFVSGAMEHWGVITFREVNLLHDEKSNPQNTKRVSTVISHEMAHMWFGNLVTMEWWDDLWLNEGFASYVEYKGVHEQHPEWDMLTQFLTDDLQSVMNIDSTLSSHPIVQPVKHPDEITEIFDSISYGKGASVLRMLEFIVGQENFRKGISSFLKKYKFRNAKTSDLWVELSEASGLQGGRNISDIMNTWTIQMGFPYVTVTRDRHNSSHFSALQQRFFKNEDTYRNLYNSTSENIWSIPLSYTTSRGKSGIVWIHDSKKVNFTLPVTDDSDWVKFNINQTGYYLVNYEKQEWDQLIELLKTDHELLNPADRSNLLFDSFLLAQGGHIPFDIFLSMTTYLKNESHLVPWETAYSSFVHLGHLLEFTDANFLLKSYIKVLTEPLYKKLGWVPATEHLNNLLQTTIIGLACHSGNEDCLSEASELFQNWAQGQEITPTMQSLVYHYGMAEIGREEHWNYMWNRYQSEESPPVRNALLYGLAHIRIPSLINRYISYAMDETKVRKQSFFLVWSFISGNPVGRPLLWNFLKEKWLALVEKFTLNDRHLGFAVKRLCNYFTTEYELQEMQSFFAKYPDAGAGKRRRQQAIENVQNNIKWLKTYKNPVRDWLRDEGTDPWLNYRLPTHIVPEHYDLNLYPELESDRFEGTVAIDVRLDKPSDCFLVHVFNLHITRIEVTTIPDNKSVTLETVFPYEPNNFHVLKAEEKLPLGRYKLYFEFWGLMNVPLKGLFKTWYTHQKHNEKRPVVSTQFEPTHARKAFPCFDEPTFRSTFTVRLRHNSSYFALSNSMVEGKKILEDGLVETRFEKSMPMVTYLLCLVICDFEYKETITENGLLLRVYTTEHNINGTDYALDIGSRIITHFEKYFNVPFPLKKLDMIAIPDSSSGGMENWGLITYSEDRMLFTPDTAIFDKYGVGETIAHELAHMWFGDLVTMKWWDDIWLNEGFASYIDVKGLELVEPTWDLENQFASEELYSAMSRDCSRNSHPIVQNIRKANEISEMFDNISYNKGASVLRMLESFMKKDFRTGVSAYLKKYAFGNAKTDDLWAELSAASTTGLNVSSLMDTWTRQMNYPYVTVKRDAEKVTLKQHHYLANPESLFSYNKPSPFGYIWQIPITYRTSDNVVDVILLNSTQEVSVALPNTSWVKFNINFTGYFIVSYEDRDWSVFTDMLMDDPHVFSPSDRTNFIFDSFSLASAGILDYSIPLNLSRYLKKEDHFGPLKIAVKQLQKVNTFLSPDPEAKELMTEYTRTISKDLLRKFTWNDTGDYNERNARIMVIDLACGNENYECLKTAADLLKRWKKGEKLSPNLRWSVYKYGMQVLKDEETWMYMWNRLIVETDAQEKFFFFGALANVRNESLLRRYVDLAKNEDYVRSYEYCDVLDEIVNNPEGQALVMDILFNNFTSLIQRSKSERRVELLAKKVFGKINTEEGLKKVQDFHRKHPSKQITGRQRRETIEKIRNNIRLFKSYHLKTLAWLQRNVYMPWSKLRLPSTVKPTLYNLRIHPNLTQSTFEGTVEIEVQVSQATDYLVLHQKRLDIQKTELREKESGRLVDIDEVFPYEKNEFWVIRLAEVAMPGDYTLKMVFSGVMLEKGFGLGRYKYTNEDTGESRYVALTQFEPTNARSAFPCFDEPVMKAKFKLTIVHDQIHSSVSNMPEESLRHRVDGLMETAFEESAPMSTYLLCYLVSDFTYLETEYRGKKIRTYAAPDRVHLTEHSLNFTVKVLEFFEDFYDITYALPKLDSVAVEGYAPNGMEHWGLIAYNELRFLVEETASPDFVLEQVDQVIAHELAHQWFGNLVTMEWWSDVWLNEGFSTFAQFVALQPFHPDAQEVYVKDIVNAMRRDSTLDSHPIITNASHPNEILDLFDSISYRKGAAVLKMLDYTLKDDFRKGVTNYLKKFAFKNTETKDLWNELSMASETDVNISEVMHTWTDQMGFPYIEIKRGYGHFTATQNWFINEKEEALVEEAVQKNPYGYLWKIPLVYKDMDTGHEQNYWLNERNATFFTNTSRTAVLKFNPEFMGYYIIKYEDDDWLRFAERLQNRFEDFPVTDRYSLLHDSVRLATSGRLLFDVPLELSKYLKKEDRLLPWQIFFDMVREIIRRLDVAGDTYRLLWKYMKELTTDLYDIYANQTSEFAQFIQEAACKTYNEKCMQTVEEQYQKWTHGDNITSRSLVIAARKFGNETLWQQMYDRFEEEVDEDMQETLAEALASFQDPTLVNRTIEDVMFNHNVSKYLAHITYKSLLSNPGALPIILDLLVNKWPLIKDRFGEAVVPVQCSYFKTMEHLNVVVTFFKRYPDLNPADTLKCLEGIQKTIEWSSEHEQNLLSWLRWNVSP